MNVRKCDRSFASICVSLAGVFLGLILITGVFVKSANSNAIQILPSKEIDLGDVDAGTSHRIPFTIEGSNDTEIVIVEVATECQCTLVELPERRMTRKGHPIHIVAQWTPGANPGPQMRHIAVNYMDGQMLYSDLLTIRCRVGQEGDK